MIKISRRTFLASAVAASFYPQMGFTQKEKLRIGVVDWKLNLAANPEAVPMAAKLGFDGIQINFGYTLVDGRMPADDPAMIARYLSLCEQYKIPIDGTSAGRLNVNGLKNDPLGPKWVLDSIRLTKALNTNVLLLPFFGRSAIQTDEEKEHVGDVLRDLAPEAEKAGVFLGLEDTLSAEDNVRILERSRSANVRVYYDTGNSVAAGYDPVKEIRWLGKDRICQFHFKDNPHYLGQGNIQFAPIVRAIQDIRYSGYANLETDAPSGQVASDMSENLAYIRKIVA
jgi:L-ribulose-5-phosphate 3-epimerase